MKLKGILVITKSLTSIKIEYRSNFLCQQTVVTILTWNMVIIFFMSAGDIIVACAKLVFCRSQTIISPQMKGRSSFSNLRSAYINCTLHISSEDMCDGSINAGRVIDTWCPLSSGSGNTRNALKGTGLR